MNVSAAPQVQTGIDDLMSLHECSRVTRLQARTISLYVSNGSIPSLKVGHARLFSRRAIREWLADRRQQTRPRVS
jgi:excisionase family DNA binding protein